MDDDGHNGSGGAGRNEVKEVCYGRKSDGNGRASSS